MVSKTELMAFYYFMYCRGRLAIEFLQRISTYPIGNFQRHTLSFLLIGIFLTSNLESKKNLGNKRIQLPSGTVFSLEEIPIGLQQAFEAERRAFTKQVEEEELKFRDLLKQLQARLNSSEYRARFAKQYEEYPDIYQALDFLVDNNQLQTEEFFTRYLELFFKKECMIVDYRQQPEEIVRRFSMGLILCDLKMFLPDSAFSKADAVHEVKKLWEESPLESVYALIRKQTGLE